MTTSPRPLLRLVDADEADDYSNPDDTEANPVESSRATGEHRKADDGKLRRALADPKRARSKYLEVANASDCFHGEHGRFRVLYTLTLFASPDLSNCFPFRATVARVLKMPLPTLNRHLIELRNSGWIHTQETRRDDGRQGSSNVTFCIPRDVLPLGEPWDGPREWKNRARSVTPKVRR